MQPINIYNSPDVKVTIDENGTPVDVYVNGGLTTSVLFYADYVSLPAQGEEGILYVTEDTNFIYRWDGAYVQVGGGSLTWGQITGTLSNQTDLQNALDDKVPYTGATGNIDIGNNSIIANDGTYDSEMSGAYFGVENNAGTEYGLLEYNRLSIVDNDTLSTMQVTSAGLTFPDSTTQTTAAVAQSLQDVTDVGNTTTNDIQLINDADVILGAGGKILMDNGSKLQEGTTDAGNGGSKGIALKCSVDYELKWEAGRLYTMEQDGLTIREVSHNFTFAPSVTDDDSKGFVIGSRWILDNGDIYTCTDATTGAAVWSLEPAKVPYTGATGNVNLGEYGVSGGYYQFDTTPTEYTQAVGNVGWNDTEGTIETLLKGGSVILEIGQKLVSRVVNGTGGNVLRSNYQVVKVTGAQGQRLQVNLAQGNNDANSADTLGLIAENISNNQSGFIVTSGIISEINTTGSLQSETWADGDPLYLSPTTAGKVTNVKPQAPNHTVIIGFVVYAHSVHGKIFVKIDNGYELDELHNVKINTPLNGQVLRYNGTTFVWENSNDSDNLTFNAPLSRSVNAISISQASGSTNGYLSSTDWSTFNNKQNALTNPVTGTGTNNEIAYFNTTGSTIGSLSTATYPSLTELSYVKGVTSAIQTQLNGKQATLTNPITGTGTSGQVAYFNGTTTQTGSATLTYSPTTSLLVNNSVTASGAIARGTNLTPTLTAAANNDTLIALDINPTFNNGAFTGVSNYGIRINYQNTASYTPTENSIVNIVNDNTGGLNNQYVQIQFSSRGSAGSSYAVSKIISLQESSNTGASLIFNNRSSAGTFNDVFRIFANGNTLIQTGGTFTDSGYKLDVNGTARVQDILTVTTGTAKGIVFAGTKIVESNNQSSYTQILIQPNSGDKSAVFLFAPSGTNTASVMEFYNSSSLSSTDRHIFKNNNGLLQIGADGSSKSIEFISNNSSIFRLFSNGNLAIGTTTDSGYKLDVNGTARIQNQLTTSGSITASSAIARGVYFNNTLVAAANNDVLVGLDIAPTFTNGAFTGVSNYALRINGNTIINNLGGVTNNSFTFSTSSTKPAILYNSNGYMLRASTDATELYIQATNYLVLTNSGNEFVLRPSYAYYSAGLMVGSSTNSGYKLDVNGTARVQGNFTQSGTSSISQLGFINNSTVGVYSNGPSAGSASIIIGCVSNSGHTAIFTKGNNAGSTAIRITDQNIGSSVNHFLVDSVGASGFGLPNGTTTVNASAQVEIVSTTKGFLRPRMTTTQRDAISSPANGLTVYDTTVNTPSIYQSSAWTYMVTSSNYDGLNIAFGSSTGTKIGTSTSQKIGFWNATPIVQPTTAVAAATLTGGGGTTLTDTDTFDGYTLKQVVKALRNTGILA
jgi:hypothetical protein